MTLPPLILLMMVGAVGLVVMAIFDGGGGNRALVKRARALGAVGRTGASHARESAIRRSSETRLDAVVLRFMPKPALLRTRLEATGYPISFTHYGAACLVVGALALVVALLVGAPALLAALEAVATGLWLPHVAVGFMMARRRLRFFKAFPDAVALMVRGLRAGLPVTETIGVIGQESPDPVGEEFRRIAEQVRLGAPLDAAMWQTARRLGLPEFNFLVISLSVQRETGGNLAETLENLEHILRRRQQMKLKIKAMSSEAVASAIILSALPFVTTALMFMVSGDYIRLLFTDPLGKVMVACAVVSMTVGATVMRQMTRFEI
ncbi:type II secretion system F family protein [Phenylobacterium sp.]|uniref:type II secretion system F family protein n=1 Tax=Phenylobacterium sp. TaxID=1871053 RepID=UPI002F9570BF